VALPTEVSAVKTSVDIPFTVSLRPSGVSFAFRSAGVAAVNFLTISAAAFILSPEIRIAFFSPCIRVTVSPVFESVIIESSGAGSIRTLYPLNLIVISPVVPAASTFWIRVRSARREAVTARRKKNAILNIGECYWRPLGLASRDAMEKALGSNLQARQLGQL